MRPSPIAISEQMNDAKRFVLAENAEEQPTAETVSARIPEEELITPCWSPVSKLAEQVVISSSQKALTNPVPHQKPLSSKELQELQENDQTLCERKLISQIMPKEISSSKRDYFTEGGNPQGVVSSTKWSNWSY